MSTDATEPVDTALLELMQSVASGTVAPQEAAKQLSTIGAAPSTNATLNLGHTQVDLDRARRTGAPEVIYGEGKTPAQMTDITKALVGKEQSVLITRISEAQFNAIAEQLPDVQYHPHARLAWLHPQSRRITPSATAIAVVSAGTSDSPVAEEAALTCEFYGQTVERFNDVGVAGIHRLFECLDAIRAARVVIVVAGMEGALPSVVGGLVDKPVIAVPTSVGYGASLGGLSALLGMLNSCASGISVVNIDNGFGAGYLATMINRL